MWCEIIIWYVENRWQKYKVFLLKNIDRREKSALRIPCRASIKYARLKSRNKNAQYFLWNARFQAGGTHAISQKHLMNHLHSKELLHCACRHMFSTWEIALASFFWSRTARSPLKFDAKLSFLNSINAAHVLCGKTRCDTRTRLKREFYWLQLPDLIILVGLPDPS